MNSNLSEPVRRVVEGSSAVGEKEAEQEDEDETDLLSLLDRDVGEVLDRGVGGVLDRGVGGAIQGETSDSARSGVLYAGIGVLSLLVALLARDHDRRKFRRELTDATVYLGLAALHRYLSRRR